MKQSDREKASVPRLVEEFQLLCLGQYEAELRGETAKENHLIKQMWAISEELRQRTGDERAALVALFDHPNVQVRLMAAKETLAVAPIQARLLLQRIRESEEQPQAMDAGMCLWNLERGVFKPE